MLSAPIFVDENVKRRYVIKQRRRFHGVEATQRSDDFELDRPVEFGHGRGETAIKGFPPSSTTFNCQRRSDSHERRDTCDDHDSVHCYHEYHR